jgi:WD40 repeat protein
LPFSTFPSFNRRIALKGLTGQVQSAVFLPDSRRIFVYHHPDRALRLYDTSTGEEIRVFAKGRSARAVSPDGRWVLTAGGWSVWLMDVETGKELHRFDGHTAAVTNVVFLPDGKFALSGSFDNTMRLWRLPDPPAARDSR